MSETTDKYLPYGRQWIDDADIRAVVDVLSSDWLTQGPVVSAFEEKLAAAVGAEFAVAVSSGTAGLHLACLAAGVGPGHRGITSPITFVASANCIAYCGGTPEFADIDPATVTMAPDALQMALLDRPVRVVVPVSFAGQAADLPAISSLAAQHGAVVIEDAAHSLGATYEADGDIVASGSCRHSDMAVLSFHPVKHITTAEGGAITTNSRSLYERLRELRSHGITREPTRLLRNDGPWYYEQHELGFNYRISDVQCALGISQLQRLPAFVARRRQLVERYQDRLSEVPGLRLLLEQGHNRSSYHLLVACLPGGPEVRRRVFERLRDASVMTQVHYIPVHLQPWYRSITGYHEGSFPEAEAYYSSCLSLPLFPAMSDGDVDRVSGLLSDVLRLIGS